MEHQANGLKSNFQLISLCLCAAQNEYNKDTLVSYLGGDSLNSWDATNHISVKY